MGWLDNSPDEIKRQFERDAPEMNKFPEYAAPIFFRWIQWAALLALLRYAHIQTGAWPLFALQAIGCLLLWAHFMYFFSDRSTKWKTEAEMRVDLPGKILGTVCAAGVFGGSLWLARVFVEHPF